MTPRGSALTRVARRGGGLLVITVTLLSAVALPSALAARRVTAPGTLGGMAGTSHARPKPKPLFEVCPVDGPRHYVDDFGDARWYGGYHRHQGIDVFADRMTPIRAPFDGRAEISESSAGGLGVYVYGKSGFVFNAHLEKLGKLGKVKAGQIVGYVGNSGDARGSSTHDHFEWHPGGGDAVDPFKLLNATCRAKPRPEAPRLELPVRPIV
jgi:murein DD-endopeptidase MepM/ murein hydrolase activator NlpD